MPCTLDQDYEEFLTDFAKVSGANSKGAVGMAITIAAKPLLAKPGNENILASALKYRFISVSDIVNAD